MRAVSALSARSILFFVLLSAMAVVTPVQAQEQLNPAIVRPLITEPIDESRLTTLKGNTHPLARPQFDLGTADGSLPMKRMLLVLKRSDEQEGALRKLLDDQQDKHSPSYHKWLTPKKFGQQYGPTDADMQTITAWLQSHGFEVGSTKGRTVLEFSGTAAQVEESFHTTIHKYLVNGQQYWANSTDPQIPAVLATVVAGINSLHNFPKKPLHRTMGLPSRREGKVPSEIVQSPSLADPSFTTNGGGCGLLRGHCYAVGPYDFATIYNVLPLWNANYPIDGSGQTIAIVGQSDIYPQDFSGFRSNFGVPSGTLNIIYNGIPPYKLASQGDELESDLDVEWSGAVAKGATIDLVASASTNSTSGIDLSAQYIVDNNLAPILSVSYGACELYMGTAGNQFYHQLWQQAAAEGISVFVSSGDSGAANCDQGSAIATQGLSVNGIASTPYDVAVGGTDFDDLQNPGTYWSLTNNPTTLESAISYIPERTWNDSCTNSEYFQVTGQSTAEGNCNDSTSLYWPYFLTPVGGSGGASNCTTSSGQVLSSCSGGYAKPAWQSGPGVPQDSARDIPDVSLYAADGMNASFYIACETDIYGGCQIALGGTSFSAPAFAGIMAMINQKMQSRQGLANYVFYPLAAQPGASCDSSGTLSASCTFYDVTTGTIAVPCTTGTPNCLTNNAGDANGVLSGYSTNAGYDLATGLGSVNVANLVDNWSSVSFQQTTSTLSLSPTTQITHGTPVNVNIAVAPTSGTGSPSGLASLLTSTGQPAGSFLISNGAGSGTTNILPGGTYTVTAHYAGDGTYAASDSSPGIAMIINPEPSTTTVQAFTLDQNGNSIPFSNGPFGQNFVYLRVTSAGQSGQGAPTGTVNLTQTLNGVATTFPGSPYTLNSLGYAQPGGYLLFPGSYSMTASYSGDASFNSSNSPALGFAITPAPTTTTISGIVPCLNLTPCSVSAGTQVWIAATVNANVSPFVPTLATGTITFYANGTQLGPPATVDSHIIPPIANMPALLPNGANTITAQYNGDSNYLASTSSSATIDVGQTFSVTASPTVINIASPGESGSTTLIFAPQYGLAGSASLSPSMCSNLPPKSTCSFNPSNVAFTSTTTNIPITLTISTTADSSQAAQRAAATGTPWISFGGCSLFLALGTLSLFLWTHRKRQHAKVAILACAMFAFVSCGGSGSAGNGGNGGVGGGGGGTGNPGTPAGTYNGVTVMVAINGITQWVNNVTVNVQ